MPEIVLSCDHGDCVFQRRMPKGGELPPRCPLCRRSGRWLVQPAEPEDIKYELNDLRFLKSIRVAPD